MGILGRDPTFLNIDMLHTGLSSTEDKAVRESTIFAGVLFLSEEDVGSNVVKKVAIHRERTPIDIFWHSHIYSK